MYSVRLFDALPGSIMLACLHAHAFSLMKVRHRDFYCVSRLEGKEKKGGGDGEEEGERKGKGVGDCY